MFRENLKASWRSLRKHRYHTVLNILGFAIALAVVILIGLFAQRELSTNMFHKDAHRIYKIGGWGCPYALAGTIEDGVPEVEAITNLVASRNYNMLLQTEDETKEILTTDGMVRTNSPFFQVFTFPLIMGDVDNPFPDYQSLVITRSTAEALFGQENPIGKTVKSNALPGTYTVSGVTEDVPLNSSLRYSVVIPINPGAPIGEERTIAQDWNSFTYEIYAKIAPKQNIPQLEQKIQDEVRQKGNLQYEVEHVKLYPLKDVYFNFADLYTSLKGGNYGQVKAMIWVGIIILFLAIVNFFNLSTASGMRRSREIGLRKVNGSTRAGLIVRFLDESILITFLAMLLALIMVNIAIPYFSAFVGATYHFVFMNRLWHWILLIGGSIVVGTVAGSYPAFYLSRISPINALYVGRDPSGFGVLFFRKVLIVLQLVASIAIIACTFIISGQLDHLRTKDLGFDKEAILTVPMDGTIYSQKQAFLSETSSVPFVEGFSLTRGVLGNWDAGIKVMADYRGEQKEIWSKVIDIDTAFFSTFGIEFVQGRAPLSHETGYAVINEAAVAAFGIDEALELRVDHYWERNDDRTPSQFYKVVGVVKDFNFKPLNQGVEPLVMYLREIPAGLINIRLNARSMDDFEQVKTEIEKVYTQFNPQDPMYSFFLDSYLAQLYQDEMKFKTIFTVFSVFAVLISCFGLFGLIIFSNARRRKEIAIRRVQGASVGKIIWMLIRDYLVYIAVSFVIAVPVAAFIMAKWLQGYPYRIEMHWWYFALAGLLAGIVVVLTVGLQSWRAATQNPVKALKTE